MNTIKVKNCQDCPFVNLDRDYGYDGCSIKEIELGEWEELPASGVHKECPLKEKDVVIKVEN